MSIENSWMGLQDWKLEERPLSRLLGDTESVRNAALRLSKRRHHRVPLGKCFRSDVTSAKLIVFLLWLACSIF